MPLDYDIVLLNLVRPDVEGYDVVRRMRAGRINTPVLILSGVSHPREKVRAFALGADDFMTKPFDQAELVARVQAVVRRSKGHSKPSLQVGPVMLNLDSREVMVDGRPVYLTSKEYTMLELLMLRKGRSLTKEAFLNHLYGGLDDEPDGKIIDVFICKLRKKLAEAGADGLIGTVWGHGYILSATPRRPRRTVPWQVIQKRAPSGQPAPLARPNAPHRTQWYRSLRNPRTARPLMNQMVANERPCTVTIAQPGQR